LIEWCGRRNWVKKKKIMGIKRTYEGFGIRIFVLKIYWIIKYFNY
jgi:hypothetical protein